MASVWNIVAAGVLTLLVPLLRDEIGLSSAEAGWALAIGAAMGVVAAPLVGPLDRRFGGVTIVLWGTVVNGVTALGVGLAFGFWALLPAICALYLAEWVTMAAFIGERQRRAPPHLQARVGISGRTINMAAATVGAALASAATEFTGLREIYVGMAVLTLLVGLVAWRPIRRAERRSLRALTRLAGRANPLLATARRPALPRRAGPRLRGAGRRERGAAVADPGRGRLDARRRARVHPDGAALRRLRPAGRSRRRPLPPPPHDVDLARGAGAAARSSSRSGRSRAIRRWASCSARRS